MGRRAKSIIQNDLSVCFCQDCTCQGDIEVHHIFYGYGRRAISDREGLIVALCQAHHRGTNGVHGRDGAGLGYSLKEIAQEAWEQKYIDEHPEDPEAAEAARDAFIKLIGRNYL